MTPTPKNPDAERLALADELEQCAKSCEVYSPDQCATLIDGIGWIAMRHKLTRAAEQLRALEQREAVPVAWLHEVTADDGEPDQALSFSRDSFPLEGVAGYRTVSVRPLYATPPRDVPEGWMLVPRDATPEMWEAGMNCWSPDDSQGDYLEKAWAAMIAAAPSGEG